MKHLITLCLLAVTMCAAAQEQVQSKRIAILETVDKTDKVDYAYELQLRQSLTFAINKTPGYKGYNRLDMAQINSEHNFQRTGFVSDTDIKKLGQMAGAAYVLIAEVTPYSGGKLMILANLVNVESGEIENSTPPVTSDMDDSSMTEACKKIAQILLNVSGAPSPTSPGSGGQNLTFTVNGVTFEMIKVEAGSFIMGCTNEQGGDCDSDESPYHRVTISQDYYIGKFEVTQELWEAVMGTNPSNWKAFDRPVECVSWNDAMEFCAELSRMTGRRFTLPTEAQWEYAARGGKKSTNAKYSGSSSAANVAWYDGNSGSQTHPVGRLRANELGIYDMSGNVWEWCLDWKGSYSSASQTDPMGPSSGSDRVLRGGSWNNYAGYCSVSNRSYYTPDNRFNSNGFRLVLVS